MVATATIELRRIEKFLSGAIVSGHSHEQLVEMTDRHIRAATQTDVKEAVALAARFVGRTRKLNASMLLIALRCAGWASLVAARYDSAELYYLEARALARRQGLPRARIDRTLIDIYMYLGRPDRAIYYARRASETFRKLKADDDLAKTWVNLANVLHRQDRHRRAHKLYHDAAAHFQRRGNDLATALCWYNEANTLVQLFEFDRAEQLYSEARAIFTAKSQPLQAMGCLYGLAWLHMLAGDFHIALKELAECEAFYQAGGHKREMILCLLDRAESYLGLNLLIDAWRVGLAASVAAGRLGIRYEEGKGLFFAARACIGLGRQRQAQSLLKRAQDLMRQEKNQGFLAAIRFDQAITIARPRTRKAQMQTARERLKHAQLPLWEAICDVQLAAETTRPDVALRRLARNRAVRVVPHLLARYQTIRGDQAAARDNLDNAIIRWTQAVDVLEAVRAKLPPVELRAVSVAGEASPYDRLIRAEAERNPRIAANWIDRLKTSGLLSPTDPGLAAHPLRQRVEESMRKLSRHVAVMSSLASPSAGRRAAHFAFQTAAVGRLREELRDNLAALFADKDRPDYREATSRAFVEELETDVPIVQFHVGDSEIQAFVLNGRDCSRVVFPRGVRILNDFVARWRFFVESAPADARSHRSSDIADERELLKQIGDWLLTPLRLPTDAQSLVIVPDGRLHCLPWSALNFGNRPVYEKYGVIQSPSIRHFVNARQQRVDAQQAYIFVGAAAGLTGLRDEAATIAKHLRNLATDVINPCRREDWPESGAARVWHFAGHAQLRSDNPFYSALLLDDGPIFAADFRLRRYDVDLVTLAACRTGQQSGWPGEEANGLVRALLEMGARTVVAGGWAVSDRSTTSWMSDFYSDYAAGAAPVDAMRSATENARREYASAFHWAAFALHGAGE